MKLTDAITLMQSIKNMYGDLELLDNDCYSIRVIVPEVVDAKQAEEWGMIEGERFAQVVSNY